jgi:hypothetical protein
MTQIDNAYAGQREKTEAAEAKVAELTERLQAVSLYATEEKTECCGFPEIDMDGYSACCGMFIKSVDTKS